MFSVIDCGKPVVPPGVRLLTDSFSVHSEARFECEPGHKLIDGELKHKCGLNGKWSGRIPVCTGIFTSNYYFNWFNFFLKLILLQKNQQNYKNYKLINIFDVNPSKQPSNAVASRLY